MRLWRSHSDELEWLAPKVAKVNTAPLNLGLKLNLKRLASRNQSRAGLAAELEAAEQSSSESQENENAIVKARERMRSRVNSEKVHKLGQIDLIDCRFGLGGRVATFTCQQQQQQVGFLLFDWL